MIPYESLSDTLSNQKDFFKDFLSISCCWSNNCCFPVSPTELTQLGDGSWKVNATGQILPPATVRSDLGLTTFSPDGGYYRCACDPVDGKWIVHEKANTRCLAVPLQGY